MGPGPVPNIICLRKEMTTTVHCTDTVGIIQRTHHPRPPRYISNPRPPLGRPIFDFLTPRGRKERLLDMLDMACVKSSISISPPPLSSTLLVIIRPGAGDGTANGDSDLDRGRDRGPPNTGISDGGPRGCP